MHKTYGVLLSFLIFVSCGKKYEPTDTKTVKSELISAVDISSFPQMAESNVVFYTSAGVEDGFLNILKQNGVNTIRLRLWVKPESKYAGFASVKQFSQMLKANGFRIWLSVHYSDTWADPGHQKTPESWANKSYQTLKDSVENYTRRVVEDIKPDYIQIGNELNTGFLHPHGNISSQAIQFIALMSAAIKTVRQRASDTKIIIHYAGIMHSDWFFNQVSALDYDIIGLSYYPIWHGKNLDMLSRTLNSLSHKYQKDVLIAETAYPFTLEWNDWTNNIVGTDEALILPQYRATPQGQRAFVKRIKTITTKEVKRGLGFCYWGGELIAWRGSKANDGSVWENQALFNFNNRALPVLEEFCFE
ncbi:glycoside hydrolase family 53 protein [Saccharicrinis carchari]|nr:glycosyl hydrolase 53 family protein [Saccharicrinis carchari]